MSSPPLSLRYKIIWLLLGYLMLGLVVQQTLTSSPVTSGMNLSDKYLHVLGYFLLMGWFTQVYHSTPAKLIWGVFFILLGVTLEYLQGLSGVRHYEIGDMLANALGVVVAWALSYTRFSSGLYRIEQLFLSTGR